MQATRDLVAQRYGRGQLELARPCLQSVIDRQHYAHYHHSEIRSLLGGFVRKHLEDASMLEVAFGEDVRAHEFNLFMTKAGAHIIGFVQSMHAIGDILAHAVYYTMGMNLAPKPLAARDISLVRVIARCREAGLDEIFDLLTEFHEGGARKQISALANHSKHRSVVRPALTEHVANMSPARHELKFSAFTYDGINYPETSVGALVEPEYARCSRLIVDIGNAFNDALG